MTPRSLSYAVSIPNPADHVIAVKLTVRGSLPNPLVVAMPAWSPGSYLVREYARHVESFHAETAHGAAGVRKVAKDSWAIAHEGADEVVITYGVYAHELTVRTNHVSETHAYWNGAATYLRPVEPGAPWDAIPIDVALTPPVPTWTIATALDPTTSGAHTYRAKHFDELVDSPVDMGEHETLPFRVRDKPHEIVLWGARPRFDREKLTRDVASIVETEAALFDGLPYDRYFFLLHLAPSGRGGLEHHNCASLLASPESFDTADNYDDLLSLFAHEFFHLWQVKRTRPEGILPYDYARENYTRMLWLFEGGTSYYDWLILRRAGLVDTRAYLKHFASEIARLEDTPGRFAQSVEEASFDAWIKLYRPDENSVNSTVSYYLKGEIVCALIDLEIRTRSNGTRSLDDVMKHLWREYGSQGRPVPESSPEALFAAATGVDVSDAIDGMVRSTAPLPYDRILGQAGLAVKPRPARGTALGVRLRHDGGRAVIGSVLRGGAAYTAGLAPGDEIIAMDGRRVDDSSFRERLRNRKPGDSIELLIARQDCIQTKQVTLGAPPPELLEIVGVAEATPEARAIGEAWLGAGSSALWGTPR